jgi:hypothetical protein
MLLIIITLINLSVYADNSDKGNNNDNNELNVISDINTPILQTSGEIAFGIFHKMLVHDKEALRLQYENVIENYAGSKIDNNGNLIIYYADNISSLSLLKNELSKNGIKKDDIQYVEVKYSYNELKEQQNSMWLIRNYALEKDEKLKKWALKIISMLINPEHNCITLLINKFDETDYMLCEKYFNLYSYEIEITEATGEIIEHLDVKPGMSISTGGSAGFRCNINGNNGFMTSIHKIPTNITVAIGNSNIGNISNIGKYDGKSDFAFVELWGGQTANNVTNTTPSFTLHKANYVVALPIDYTVYMAGVNKTSVRVGKVINNDYSMDKGTEWLLCDYPSEPGDSGGVIFANVNNDYCVVGIHNGSVDYYVNNIKTKKAYSTKLNTMMKYYTITLY